MQNKQWYENNIEKARETGRKQYQNDKERSKKAYRKWREENRKRHNKSINAWHKRKKEENPLYRLKANLRTRLSHLLKAKKWNKNCHFSEYLGCTLEKFKIWVESKFVPGMSWSNYGEWHIDHIVPISIAQTEKEVYELFHYGNLQPLWGIDNIKKSNKLTY